MASAFWTLEDGRGFARRWSGMSNMLRIITDELRTLNGANDFYNYLEKFVYREEKGDEYNGYGGFIRGEENIMFNFDLRSFAPINRDYFWQATEKAFNNLKTQEDEKNEQIIFLFTTLLDMHKRIDNCENPAELNDMKTVEPNPNKKLGPGW